MLVRDRSIVYRSPVLQHFFDCPLQFGAVPDYSESTDSAEDAAVAELQVQPGSRIGRISIRVVCRLFLCSMTLPAVAYRCDVCRFFPFSNARGLCS